MFKIEKTKNIDSTTLNNKYNQMLMKLIERGISNRETNSLLILRTSFQKVT